MVKVAIIMGSKSDFESVLPAKKVLDRFGIENAMLVMSAHRTIDEVNCFAKQANDNGYKIIIAAAGKAAHLAGVIAASTVLPVIGIPIKSSTLDGLDSLLSTVQMPNGIPVATVAIGGSENAALLAIEMLAISDNSLTEKLKEYRQEMKAKIELDNESIQQMLL
ncbi:MAG: 5-(carboxyamino)imidazole ribonucleotide mutase [Clostridia bacterium]